MNIIRLLPGFIRKNLRELKTKRDFQLDLKRVELIRGSSIEDLKEVRFSKRKQCTVTRYNFIDFMGPDEV